MNEHLSTIEPASASDLPPGLDIPGAQAVYADGAVPPRPANRRGAGPPAEAQVHFRVHAQRGLAGVLDTIAGAGRLLGHPFALVCLLRDAGTDAWYTTALLDMDGRPLDFARMQVPAGPYLFEAPAGFAMQPLVETLAAAWGVPAARRWPSAWARR